MKLKVMAVLLSAGALTLAACDKKQTMSAAAEAEALAAEQAREAAELEQAMMRDLGGLPGFANKLVEKGDRVYFATNKYNLEPDAQVTLQRQAALLKIFPLVTVTVEGYCDERGTREYNLALGARRANTARNYLVALGVNGERLSTISYGKDVTLVPGSTPEAWAQNRVAITVANV